MHASFFTNALRAMSSCVQNQAIAACSVHLVTYRARQFNFNWIAASINSL
jgi:hypothetical protein